MQLSLLFWFFIIITAICEEIYDVTTAVIEIDTTGNVNFDVTTPKTDIDTVGEGNDIVFDDTTVISETENSDFNVSFPLVSSNDSYEVDSQFKKKKKKKGKLKPKWEISTGIFLEKKVNKKLLKKAKKKAKKDGKFGLLSNNLTNATMNQEEEFMYESNGVKLQSGLLEHFKYFIGLL
ncbi:unnamed protein product [Candida verbasci]|uniref:Uncharacterized protein n=1 Tax=Candida verbasci TaxID=1227364 RepID=A0A9W4X8R6_9ASCO|nr:unnamed protein product [Candida verbasci]